MTYPHPEEDLYESAMEDEPQCFFGQPSFNLWKCILEKGTGKVPYDPNLHAGRRTSIAIELTLTPIDPTRRLIQRQMLNWTPDFKGVMRPSIEALADQIAEMKGLQVGQFSPLKAIEGMFTSGEFVPRPDNKPGQTWTTLRFDAVYASREACEAAHAKKMAELGIDGASPEADEQLAPMSDDSEQRAAMAAFLPALWAQAQKTSMPLAEMDKLLKANPMLAGFTLASSEVVALTGSKHPAGDFEQEIPF